MPDWDAKLDEGLDEYYGEGRRHEPEPDPDANRHEDDDD